MTDALDVPYSSPRPPLQDFWVVICVRPKPGTSAGNSPWLPPASVGYFQKVGVRAIPERLRAVLETMVAEGAISWDETDFERIDLSDLDPDVLSRAKPIETECVWYRSGRVFFSES